MPCGGVGEGQQQWAVGRWARMKSSKSQRSATKRHSNNLRAGLSKLMLARLMLLCVGTNLQPPGEVRSSPRSLRRARARSVELTFLSKMPTNNDHRRQKPQPPKNLSAAVHEDIYGDMETGWRCTVSMSKYFCILKGRNSKISSCRGRKSGTWH